MSVENNKAVIRRWIEEAWNQGNSDLADELYCSDFVARDIDNSTPTIQGPAGIKNYLVAMRNAFPDIHFTIDHLFAEGDRVVGAFTIRGTHRGDFGDIPATGKRIVFQAVDIWRFKNGKIVERSVALIDRLNLMQQLGVLPS
jgi:steroid delta-isomerase-like uncharacterized protein